MSIQQKLLVYPVTALLLFSPLIAFFALRVEGVYDPIWDEPNQHFLLVSLVALLVAAFAVAIARAAQHYRNLQVTFLALSFLFLAGFFAIHGLTTPGVILGPNSVVAVSPQISIFTAAIFLALAAQPTDRAASSWLAEYHHSLLVLAVVLIAAFGAAAFLAPWFTDFLPLTSPPLNWTLTGVTIAFCLYAVYYFWQAYRFSRLSLQAILLMIALLLAQSQVIMSFGEAWHVSWWIYHFVLLAISLLLMGALIGGSRRGTDPVSLMEGLFASSPMRRLMIAGYPGGVTALVTANEARDPYTGGHSERVARISLLIGKELGLGPDELRALVHGAVLHDVGKIGVGDGILHKPGPLDAEERAVINEHPIEGYEMARRIGIMGDELDIILHHHEWWDGSGYPDGLAGEEIPLLARIVCVADVYDALRSQRTYRDAMDDETAREVIAESAGTHFDPEIVTIFLKLADEESLAAPP